MFTLGGYINSRELFPFVIKTLCAQRFRASDNCIVQILKNYPFAVLFISFYLIAIFLKIPVIIEFQGNKFNLFPWNFPIHKPKLTLNDLSSVRVEQTWLSLFGNEKSDICLSTQSFEEALKDEIYEWRILFAFVGIRVVQRFERCEPLEQIKQRFRRLDQYMYCTCKLNHICTLVAGKICKAFQWKILLL